MVVIIPKKRQCKRCFSVGYICILLSAALLICYFTGVKMTAWNDFIGQGAQGLEGGRTSLFPRSLSPLYDYQKILWGGAGSDEAAAGDSSSSGVVGSEVKGDGGRLAGAKIKRESGGGDGDHVGVVSRKGNFNIDDLSDTKKMDMIIRSHLTICSHRQAQLEHVLQNSTHPYHGMITTSLKAMRTYVPQQYHPKFTNPCWFASMPGLPPLLHKNFTEYRGCMPNAMSTYTEQRAYEIVRLSVTTPANGARKIMDSLNLTHTADIIPPQCRLLADQAAASPSTNPHQSSHSFMSVNASKLFRECTQRYKLYCMPQVLLAGFPKCATSSMYFMMIKHPELAAARMKEQHLWRDSFIDTDIRLPHKQIQMLYYIYHFERASNEILKNRDHLTIDGSTTTIVPGLYIPYHQVEDMCITPRMVTKLIPNARMIIMMRNPVDRLYSDYWYLCAKFSWKNGRVVSIPTSQAKNATRVFHQMSAEMIDSFHRCLETESVFECVRQAGVGYAPEVACKGPRIGLSLYYFHIVRWLNILPRDHILFLRTEDFLTDPYTAMKKVYHFLGVSPPRTGHSMTTLTNRNVNEWIKSSEYRKDFVMPKETRNLLNRFFEPYNKMLSRLLKDDRYTWNDIQY